MVPHKYSLFSIKVVKNKENNTKRWVLYVIGIPLLAIDRYDTYSSL